MHGFCGFYGVLLVGVVAGGYPTGPNNVPVSFGGQLMGVLTFVPLAFLSGYVVSWILRQLRLLRVPAEVELVGLDPGAPIDRPLPGVQPLAGDPRHAGRT